MIDEDQMGEELCSMNNISPFLPEIELADDSALLIPHLDIDGSDSDEEGDDVKVASGNTASDDDASQQ